MVLVAESYDEVRRVYVRYLNLFGFLVREAQTATEALAGVEAAPRVILDGELGRLRPAALDRVLRASGDRADGRLHPLDDPAGVPRDAEEGGVPAFSRPLAA